MRPLWKGQNGLRSQAGSVCGALPELCHMVMSRWDSGQKHSPTDERRRWRRQVVPAPSQGWCAVYTCEVLGSLTQEDAGATNLFHQPKYSRPRGACCLGPLSRVWGNSRLHRYLCWLLSTNEELKHYHCLMSNTRDCRTQRKITSGHRT